jgi:hypothetical protein
MPNSTACGRGPMADVFLAAARHRFQRVGWLQRDGTAKRSDRRAERCGEPLPVLDPGWPEPNRRCADSRPAGRLS